MITIVKEYDGTTSVDKRRKDLVLLSTDTKPTDVGNGSICLEMDTGTWYVFNEAGTAWVAQ